MMRPKRSLRRLLNRREPVVACGAHDALSVSIEDDILPKRCSFYTGVKRELAPTEEHARKVAAAKAAQRDPEFVVVARTEALIAGWGKGEALARARAYADAGADGMEIDTFEDYRRAWAEIRA